MGLVSFWKRLISQGEKPRSSPPRPPAPAGEVPLGADRLTRTESADFSGWHEWEPPYGAIKGESHYRQNLMRLAGPPTEDGYTLPVVVTLRRDSENAHDANAIRAEVEGLQVGYIASEVASELALEMDSMGCTECNVAGVIRGGSFTAPDYGVHLWPHRRLGAGPPLTSLENTRMAHWPPPGASVPRIESRAGPSSDAETGVDLYYRNLQRIERAWNKLDFERAIRLCHESMPLIPAVLDWSRSISGGDVRIRSIPPIENLCRAYAARADRDALNRLKEEVSQMGPDAESWREDIEDAMEQAEVARLLYELVCKSPGFIQRNLSKQVPGAKGRGSNICYWADQMGLLRRERAGGSYGLYPTDRTPRGI